MYWILELPASQQQVERLHHRMMLEQVPHHEHALIRSRKLHEGPRFAQVKANRFLDKDILARLEGCLG